jgi:hypothetical protein
MRELSEKLTLAPGEAPSETASEASGDGAPKPAEGFIVVSHDLLFGDAPSSRCDACGEAIATTDSAEGAPGYGIPGQGVYMWARGEETRFESVPLCASCASAIGMTALGRWEIEEEEG